MTPYLFIVLLPMVALIARDALLDRTPRRQSAPEEVHAIHRDRLWWATKRTRREQFHMVDLMLLIRRRERRS